MLFLLKLEFSLLLVLPFLIFFLHSNSDLLYTLSFVYDTVYLSLFDINEHLADNCLKIFSGIIWPVDAY